MPGFVLARLSAIASVVLVTVLFAIPADEARAHNDNSATLHAETYPLHEAAQAGDLDSVNHFLIVHMADVNAKTNYDDTPLHYATGDFTGIGHVPVVSVLIAAGADVNAREDEGLAPLHYAALKGNLPVISMLIEAGANVNAKHHFNQTPLHEAAEGGHAPAISLLIAAGAEVNAKDSEGGTPLHEAARLASYDHISVAVFSALIAAGADVNAKDNNGNTPLLEAAQGYGVNGVLFIVATLIAAGANVNVKNSDGKPPLHLAITQSAVSVALTLLAAGANVHAEDDEGYTALIDAAYYGLLKVVNRLLELGADVNAAGDDGWTALHRAAFNGRLEVVNRLLESGGNVNAKILDGEYADATPLEVAFRRNHDDVRDHLIESGGHWGEACVSSFAVNPAGPSAPCICKAGTVEINGECEVVAVCDSPAILDAAANRCDCPSPNVGTDGADAPGECAAPSEEVCAGLTRSKFYDSTAEECAEFKGCRSGATLNRGENICECASPSVLDGTGLGCEFTLQSCAAANLHYNGANCEPLADCATPSTRNQSTNQCECRSPNLGTGGDCQAPSVESCGGLTPPKFYDSTAGECAEFKRCRTGATLNRGENICECASPSIPDGTGLGCEFTLESCAAANLHYNGANCEPLADCAAPSTRNQSTNQCECHSPNLGTGGDCQAPSAESCAEFYNPPRFYDANAGECAGRLYPCHDSAIRKADNSGCECPSGTFAHGDPSGGSHSHIPDTAICHANHAPIFHDLNGWLDSIQADNHTLILHFISEHDESPNQLAHAIQHSAHRAITILINRGANLNLADSDGDTPLHLAARRADTPENAALVSFLLDKGADPNIFNNSRWRPLDLADGRDGYPRRRKIMSALIAGGANWSDECVGGKVPNEFTPPKCKCPPRLSIDNNGLCECPGHSHSQVNGLCLPKDSAQVEGEIAKMQVELARLRAALVSLNARLSLSAEMPREMVEDIAEQARETAAEIDWRRANFVALGRRAEAGEAPPPVALSDTAAECRMRGGEVRIDSGSGTRICLGLDRSGTFCLVDSGDAFPCRGLFKHVRRCNDVYHRPALNAFICGERCGADETARGNGCE